MASPGGGGGQGQGQGSQEIILHPSPSIGTIGRPDDRPLQDPEMPLEGSYPLKSDFDPEEFVSSGSSGGEFDPDLDHDLDVDLDHLDLNGDDPSTSEGSEEEDEEEEDLDFLDEDEGSESEALFDHLFIKFRHILDARVDDVERFYDRGLVRKGTLVDVAIQTDDAQGVDEPATLTSMSTSTRRPELANSCAKTAETQTDTGSVVGLLASREEPDRARVEIGKLRNARDPLNQERKGMAERLKAVKKVGGTTFSVRWEEKQLYELEEAIEAIDLAIEFKNEIICGHETILSDKLAPGQERAELVTRLASLSVFDLQRLFCKFFVKVVEFRYCTKRLERNVDKLEGEREQMRRIISIYKKSLKEKDEEHENRIKLLLRQCAKAPGVGGGGGGGGDILWMTQELSKAKRKLLDFQHALTELLVRHGYLLDGADFDVKHVVRMLGLDFGELKQMEGASQPQPHPHQHQPRSSSHHSHRPQRRNINQRRNAEPEPAVPFHLHSASSSSSRRQQQQQEYGGHGSGQSTRQPSSSSSSSRPRHHNSGPFEGIRDRGSGGGGHRERSRDTKDRDRHGHNSRHNVYHNHHHVQGQGHGHGHGHGQLMQQQHEESPQHGTEVKRLKKKLIIQPNTSQ